MGCAEYQHLRSLHIHLQKINVGDIVLMAQRIERYRVDLYRLTSCRIGVVVATGYLRRKQGAGISPLSNMEF